jgi:hypothetical protein
LGKEQLKAEFQEKLDLFCLFHLGSDVQVELREETDHLWVLLEHHRIDPVQFRIPYPQLQEFLADSAQLERFLLEEITSHRR